ncbi:hypothetical protein TIFTF001_030137 [Ficus carica]|uniref:Tyrosine specific protein phosphatases domain-containing protein n=1 Tax=Ficus carica TaxID=3494 RepID=A0AA88IZ69_FICCA|nr:hypothetical protein TIFTF001_030137 [Ficus carica]
MRNAYLCVPTWDTRSPQPADIELAVKWACWKREQQRPVFVHCAYGMPSIAKASAVSFIYVGNIVVAQYLHAFLASSFDGF